MQENRVPTLAALAALGIVLLGVAPARAQSPLPPGTTSGIAVPLLGVGAPPFGGTLLQEARTALSATNGPNTIAGAITSAVYRSGSGFLDFAYQFTFAPATNLVVDTISLSSFSNVPGLSVAQSLEDIDGAGGLFVPPSGTGSFSSANRPNVSGDGINATLLTGITHDQASFVLLVRTRATRYTQTGSASVQGGGISAFTISTGAVMPLGAAAPEPASLWLLALGALAPFVGAKRRTPDRA